MPFECKIGGFLEFLSFLLIGDLTRRMKTTSEENILWKLFVNNSTKESLSFSFLGSKVRMLENKNCGVS